MNDKTIEYIDYNKYMYKFERSTPYFYHDPEYMKSNNSINSEMPSEKKDPENHDEDKQEYLNTNANTNIIPTSDLNTPNIYYPSFVMDPLSIIVKLAIVGKKPQKTKISIMNHSIIIHEPGFFQGIVRYYNNSTKQDLHYLEAPLEVACIQYIIEKTYALQRELMVSLFYNAVIGLEKLSETYKQDSMVVLCINHYINIIHNSISMNSIIANKDNSYHEKYYNNVLIEKMNHIWSPEKIDIVLRLADCIGKPKSSSGSVRSLETFIESIDNEVYRMLKNDCSNNV